MTTLTRFISAPFSARAWKPFGYLTVMLLLSPFAFAYVVLVPSLIAALAVTVVGLWVPGWLIVAAGSWGVLYRRLAAACLGQDIAAPFAAAFPSGFWRSYAAHLGNPTGWKALAFMFLSFPLAIIGWVLSTVVLVLGLGGISYSLWREFLPAQRGTDGEMHRGASFGEGYFLDSTPSIVLVGIIGVICLWCWPGMTGGFARLFAGLTRGLLGQSATNRQLAQAITARDLTVSNAQQTLQQLERSLHDGLQAQIVAAGMQISEARLMLEEGYSPEEIDAVLAKSQHATRETIEDLRSLTRTIHPPILDSGLGPALESLVSRSGLTVHLHAEALDELAETQSIPAPIVTVAYFAVSESLTNVAKHAGATEAWVSVQLGSRQSAKYLKIEVRDEGCGGADAARGTGLRGLQDRLLAVDGTLKITSPPGGPTQVLITLPLGSKV